MIKCWVFNPLNRFVYTMRLCVLVSLSGCYATQAENMSEHDNFDHKPEDRWRFVTDQVMGGVSTGRLRFDIFREQPIAHMIGDVSTANNGGFIQVRAKVSRGAAKNLKGVRLLVKGNEDSYYIHLRVAGSFVPWHYYQQEFYAPNQWVELILPFSSFERSSRILRKDIDPAQIVTLGVVAYGKNYDAEIWIAKAEFY